jgi:hypothetical protein
MAPASILGDLKFVGSVLREGPRGRSGTRMATNPNEEEVLKPLCFVFDFVQGFPARRPIYSQSTS